MQTLELEEVVRLAGQGNAEALGELHRRLARRMMGLCRHMLGSSENAEDAVGEIFLRLPRAIASYDESLAFERWLFSIVSHHCIDLLRRLQRERRCVSDLYAEVLTVAMSAFS